MIVYTVHTHSKLLLVCAGFHCPPCSSSHCGCGSGSEDEDNSSAFEDIPDDDKDYDGHRTRLAMEEKSTATAVSFEGFAVILLPWARLLFSSRTTTSSQTLMQTT